MCTAFTSTTTTTIAYTPTCTHARPLARPRQKSRLCQLNGRGTRDGDGGGGDLLVRETCARHTRRYGITVCAPATLADERRTTAARRGPRTEMYTGRRYPLDRKFPGPRSPPPPPQTPLSSPGFSGANLLLSFCLIHNRRGRSERAYTQII